MLLGHMCITWATLTLKQGIWLCKLQIISTGELSIVRSCINQLIFRVLKSLQNPDPREDFPTHYICPLVLEGDCTREHFSGLSTDEISLLIAFSEHWSCTVEIL